MKYVRQKIENHFFEGMELYQKPDLPKFEFKKGKTTYTVTDLRCLNTLAVDVLMDILQTIISTPNCTEVSYDVSQLEEDERNLVSDIVTAVDCSYKKRGYSGQLCFLSNGVKIKETQDGKVILTFELIEENAETIYNYAQANMDKKGGKFNYLDLAVAVIDESEKRMREALEHNEIKLDEVIK